MAWVTHNAPPDRRGRESGIVMGMLSAGSIAGPLVGAFASFAGTAPAFLCVAVISALSVLVSATAPSGTAMEVGERLFASLAAGLEPAVRAGRRRDGARRHDRVRHDRPARPARPRRTSAHRPPRSRRRSRRRAARSGRRAARADGSSIASAPVRSGSGPATAIALFPLVLAFGLPRGGLLAVLVIGGPVFTVGAAAMYPLASAGADVAGIPHVAVNGILGASWATGFTIAPVAASLIASAASQAVAFSVSAALIVPLLVLVARDGKGAGVPLLARA